jgi:hypothetical protein
MNGARTQKPFSGPLLERDPDEEETELDTQADTLVRARHPVVTAACRPPARPALPSASSLRSVSRARRDIVDAKAARPPSLWDRTPELPSDGVGPAIVPIPLDPAGTQATIDRASLNTAAGPKPPLPARAVREPVREALLRPAGPRRRPKGGIMLIAALASMLTAWVGTMQLLARVQGRAIVTDAEVTPVRADPAAVASEMLSDAILYRTADASPERRRRIEHHLADLESRGAIEPHSNAAILRAILATRVERAHLGEDVSTLVDSTNSEPEQPVPVAKRHLSRAIEFYQTKRSEDAQREIAQAREAVHDEAAFVVDMADALIDGGSVEGARTIVEAPSWPWSHPGATIVECRFAIASGDLERATSLITDLRASGRLDAQTLRRFEEKSGTNKHTDRPKRDEERRSRHARAHARRSRNASTDA